MVPLVTTICTSPVVASSGVSTLIWSLAQAGLVSALQNHQTLGGVAVYRDAYAA